MPFANLFRSRKRFSHVTPPKEDLKMKKPESPGSESPTYVTREELDALTRVVGLALARIELAHRRTGYADGNVAAQLETAEREGSMPAAERAVLRRIIKSFDATLSKHLAAERQRASERGNAYHRISG
jgi:hypothetical protein